jgi:hypothetical protein
MKVRVRNPPFFKISLEKTLCFSPYLLKKPAPKKTDPHIRVLTAVLMSDGINYVKKPTSIQRPLAAFERDAFLPYFGKRGVIQAYFSYVPNRTVLRGFPDA